MAIIKPKLVKITEVNENPNNPRFIEDEKFEKLVLSIKEFPEMLEIRPIAVTGENNMALGGNQRLKASKAAGLTEVWIIDLSHLSPEKQQEFIIKDNLAYGEWDWGILTKDFLTADLKKWGLEKEKKTVTFEVKGDFADQGISPKSQYAVMITCKDETDQKKVFEKMQKEGYICKIVVT